MSEHLEAAVVALLAAVTMLATAIAGYFKVLRPVKKIGKDHERIDVAVGTVKLYELRMAALETELSAMGKRCAAIEEECRKCEEARRSLFNENVRLMRKLSRAGLTAEYDEDDQKLAGPSGD